MYVIVHSLELARKISFGNLHTLDDNAVAAAGWIEPECSYKSVLLNHQQSRRKITFRRDPNLHFSEIAAQLLNMLVQDLVTIFDQMMGEILIAAKLNPANFPQDKMAQINSRCSHISDWSSQGCIELIACRNILTHCAGRWEDRSIQMIAGFIDPPPKVGDRLVLGIGMLFRFRKAIRTYTTQAMLELCPDNLSPKRGPKRKRHLKRTSRNEKLGAKAERKLRARAAMAARQA